jgi:hypothetical protein
MVRITADSVNDDQLDKLYRHILHLERLHLGLQQENGHELCGECENPFPCTTRLIVQGMKREFTARRDPHPTDVEERTAQNWCYLDPISHEWVHAPLLHRGCILR